MTLAVKACQHVGCNRPVAAKDLCDTHYKRLRRHGTSDAGWPADRGKREKHPLYKIWCGIMRYHSLNCDPRWHDLWTFVLDVGEMPSERARFSRPDRKKPWGKGNFYWKEVSKSPEDREELATKMRAYQQTLRDANPDYFRDKDLRRNYGVSLAWYEGRLVTQGNTCAICRQPETLVIHGRLVRLAVDHCHDKGHARGLLCSRCNQGLGYFRHDPATLRAALAYLDSTV